ncbi:hypothetical protein ACLOJK_023530 [Asimina triloba]
MFGFRFDFGLNPSELPLSLPPPLPQSQSLTIMMKSKLCHLFLLLISNLSILTSNLHLVSCHYCHDHQKSALLHFFSTTSSSSSLPSWTPRTDCCDWDGVTCDPATGHVIAIDVSDRSISAINSSSFASLGSLLSLNLSYNNFGSSIPSNLSLLPNLTHLNLSNSGFAGQIPAEIARLNKLVALDISTSFLNSPLTSLKLDNPSIGSLLGNLSRLTKLHLDGVNISSAVPKFLSNFTDLACLRLSYCRLVGEFPANIFLLPKLETLDVSTNPQLMGSLRDFPGESALRMLQLSATRFSGSLPYSFGNLRNLTRVELSNCFFSGRIPSSVRNLSGIVHLKLGLNGFGGPIPSLDGLTELQLLDLSFNSFSDQIPSLANLTRLAVLDLSFNNFSGWIPPLDSLKAITEIVLASNNLTGEIPQSSGDGLHNLTVLDLGNNSLHGKIPSYLFTLPSLQKLVLSQNHLGGQLNVFGNASFPLETIDLSYNKLQGQIPSSIFRYTGLKVLDLSSNNFSGSLDLVIIQNTKNLSWLGLSDNKLLVNANVDSSSFPQLRKLYLGSCKLKQFPDFLRNQSRMVELDLSNNIIDGEIPNWMWSVGSGSLRYLNLSQNSLTRLQQPYNLSSSSLSILDLHSNQLQGEIPNPPVTVVVLDYSKNNFTSTISSDFATSIGAAIFYSISGNNVSGEISSTLCTATYLQVLDLSDNQLKGDEDAVVTQQFIKYSCLSGLYYQDKVIVSSKGLELELLKILTIFKYVDLSNNKFEGELPKEIGALKLLHVLNISNNHLTGQIPASIGNLSQLESLDLSENQLSGDIPPQLSQLTFLEVLNLSDNQLVGSIPTGPQLQTFSSDSFLGNPQLCGMQLSRKCSSESADEGEESSSSTVNWLIISVESPNVGMLLHPSFLLLVVVVSTFGGPTTLKLIRLALYFAQGINR